MDIERHIAEYSRIDIGALRDGIARMDDAFWASDRAVRTKFAGTRPGDAVYYYNEQPRFLRRSALDELRRTGRLDVLRNVSRPLFEIIDAIVTDHIKPLFPDCDVMRVQLAELPPGGVIDPHQDLTILAQVHRLHIPIVTSDAVVFTIGGEDYALREGILYELNNVVTHSVRNGGEQTRIHLLVDMLPASLGRARYHDDEKAMAIALVTQRIRQKRAAAVAATDSGYDDAATIAEQAGRGRHRETVGGKWEEIGQLQRDFLIAQGLLPGHRLLDVGCGALRGGVKLIPYLGPGNYWGIDKNRPLLDQGWGELEAAGLASRQPREQLVELPDFEFSGLGMLFDYALAQSVFTHLSLNRIRRCLARLAPCIVRGGRFYASFFEVEPSADRESEQIHQPGGAISHSDRSFYHYSQRDMAFAIEGLPWEMRCIGDWGHPRGQRMLLFVRR